MHTVCIPRWIKQGWVLCLMQSPLLFQTLQEALDGYRRAVIEEGNNPEAVRKRAMADPEVQAILADPAMQMILDQMSKDPKAVRE